MVIWGDGFLLVFAHRQQFSNVDATCILEFSDPIRGMMLPVPVKKVAPTSSMVTLGMKLGDGMPSLAQS